MNQQRCSLFVARRPLVLLMSIAPSLSSWYGAHRFPFLTLHRLQLSKQGPGSKPDGRGLVKAIKRQLGSVSIIDLTAELAAKRNERSEIMKPAPPSSVAGWAQILAAAVILCALLAGPVQAGGRNPMFPPSPEAHGLVSKGGEATPPSLRASLGLPSPPSQEDGLPPPARRRL